MKSVVLEHKINNPVWSNSFIVMNEIVLLPGKREDIFDSFFSNFWLIKKKLSFLFELLEIKFLFSFINSEGKSL